MIRSFIVGAVTGGAIVWLWGGDIRRALDGMAADLRRRAADGLEQAAARLQAAASSVEERRAG